MMNTIINGNILFALDIVVLLALGFAMVYVYRLNKQLQHFNESREELKVFLSSFGESLKHTKMGIREIKAIGDHISLEIKKKISEAKSVKDELSFFVDRSSKSIEELEEKIALAKEINFKPNFVQKESSTNDNHNNSSDERVDQDIINRIKRISEEEDIEKNPDQDNLSQDAILEKLQKIR